MLQHCYCKVSLLSVITHSKPDSMPPYPGLIMMQCTCINSAYKAKQNVIWWVCYTIRKIKERENNKMQIKILPITWISLQNKILKTIMIEAIMTIVNDNGDNVGTA